jgi:hypothetical protein
MYRYTALLLSLIPVTAAAQASFAGTWVLDHTRHAMIETADVTYSKTAAGMHYAARREYDFALDGRDYPGAMPGASVAWTPMGANAWEVLEKANGALRRKMRVELSADGQTLQTTYTWFNPGNRTARGSETFTRLSGTSGLEGTWHSVQRVEEPDYLYIALPAPGQMYQFLDPSEETWAGPLDGTFMLRQGSQVAKGTSESFKLVSPNKLLFQRKVDGRVITEGAEEVSPDGRTLTMQVWVPGNEDKKRILVLDRQ